MKKPILIPIGIAERMTSFKPENRLLSAVGQFSPKRKNFWYPLQSYFLTEQSINEANMFFKRLTRTVLRNDAAMRRFCAANEDAKQPDFWCPTFCLLRQGKRLPFALYVQSRGLQLYVDGISEKQTTNLQKGGIIYDSRYSDPTIDRTGTCAGCTVPQTDLSRD
jgi:hypothetical protein